MPPPELTGRLQKAVLWPALGVDAYGQARIGSPVELVVRWNDTRSEILSPQGTNVSLDGTAIVDRDIAIESRMWLGALADLPGTTQVPEADWMVVKSFSKTLDIKARVAFRQVGLMRLRNPGGS